MVRSLAGHGDLRIMAGAGHQLNECSIEVRKLLLDWLPSRLADMRTRD
jgi:hypothetical protein